MWPSPSSPASIPAARRDRKSVVKGKSVDLGGRRIIKKKKRHRVLVDVLEGNPGRLAERHDPVAVERAAGVDRDGERDDLRVAAGVFFFQAEDGIRDLIVTGVQTCALPI